MKVNVNKKKFEKKTKRLTRLSVADRICLESGTKEMTTLATTKAEGLKKFSSKAHDYLHTIYRVHDVKQEDFRGKIDVLRKMLSMESSTLAADGGIQDDADELRILEFLELTRVDLI